jgi:Beta-ketoacyl synthase, N-terminal domain
MARVVAAGVLTGWGPGIAALPADARRAAGDRRIIKLDRPALAGDRFRRATRECLLGVAAVENMLGDGGLGRDAIRGDRTALVYVTAAAYGASNRLFVEAGSARLPRAASELSTGGVEAATGIAAATLHFPYTAPSAVPAEVAIEFGLTGGYVILIGAAPAAIDALWQAGTLLAGGRCDRALVLAVETFEECADLYARGRWLARGPLVEAAACVLLVADGVSAADADPEPGALEISARVRAGETLACAPLIALALARQEGGDEARVTGAWRGRRAGVRLGVQAPTSSA